MPTNNSRLGWREVLLMLALLMGGGGLTYGVRESFTAPVPQSQDLRRHEDLLAIHASLITSLTIQAARADERQREIIRKLDEINERLDEICP